ncbi:hypothetical protein WJ28_24185 [Burkholderia thailandensis]|nr:hypothetical protein WJ27_22700 [Burkholderia thailandensis]KVG21504.1 hypothetical protein WJ28_24185 [Burkholderia thailandensis]
MASGAPGRAGVKSRDGCRVAFGAPPPCGAPVAAIRARRSERGDPFSEAAGRRRRAPPGRGGD